MKEKTSLQDTADQLHSSALHLMRWIRTQDDSLGLSPARLSALSVIVFGGPCTLNQLAQAEQVKPPTICRIVDALEKQGFVKRKTSDKDQRSIFIHATEKGTLLLHEGKRKRVKFLADHLKRLKSDELENIRTTSQIIRSMLQQR
jgi:DNA-binding MarR family transcriptional regulator